MAGPTITIKLDVKKIAKEHLFQGEKGTYCDLALWDKPSDYGNGYVTQNISREARERGEKGPILGNWKRFAPRASAGPSPSEPPSQITDKPDDLPF